LFTLEFLYQTHKDLVYNLALNYVQNSEDAEEITQDVFLSVYQSMSSFKAQANIKTWIYRITINKSLDFLKAKKRQKRFSHLTSLFFDNSSEIKFQESDFKHPGIIMEEKEAFMQLFKTINQLPDNQKTVLILSKIENKSQKEIAEIMNLSIKAVESLFQRAKKNIEKKYPNPKD
jgi:RNA polymerase sigma-70 factor (ECF subfamily)